MLKGIKEGYLFYLGSPHGRHRIIPNLRKYVSYKSRNGKFLVFIIWTSIAEINEVLLFKLSFLKPYLSFLNS